MDDFDRAMHVSIRDANETGRDSVAADLHGIRVRSSGLGRSADLVRHDRVSVYAINRESIARAVETGLTPEAIKEFLNKIGFLGLKRAGRCPGEYRDLRWAFNQTIMPHVDKALMQRVQAMQILFPDDVK